jgi:glutaredoxin
MFKIYGYDSNVHRCTYCDNAKRLLDVKKQPYEFISIMPEKGHFDEAAVDEMLKLLGRESQVGLTVPQIFAPNGTHIGGFNELRDYFK